MVAVAILSIALLALARTATVAFTDVAAARQRQTASQLANQLVEQVVALPWETVQEGLKTNQLDGDQNAKNCGGTYYLFVCPPDPTAEKIRHENNVGNDARPLFPHQGEEQPEGQGTTYAWRVYVTEYVSQDPDALCTGCLRVTAIVSWDPAQREGVRASVDSQDVLYSPTGSTDEATHPFTGPRQAYFFGAATAGGGTYSTTGTVSGLTFDQMSAELLQTTSTVQTEQTIRVEGGTNLPGLSKTVSGVETTSGSTSAGSVADTDPTTTQGLYERWQIGPQPWGAQLAVGANSNVLLAHIDGEDQGETTSATAAGGSSPCTLQNDGLPCGFGSARLGDGGNESDYGDYDTSMHLVVPNMGVANLLRVNDSSTPTTAYTRRTGSGPNGLVRGEVSWTLPEIRLGGIPSEMDSPSNWSGFWVQLSGFTATARAESGPGATAPTMTLTGTVRYWRGSNYRDEQVTQNGKNITDIGRLSFRDNLVGPNNDRVDILIEGTVSIGRSALQRAVNAGATTEATATVASPMVAEFTYSLIRNNTEQVANLTITFNAGGARVSTSYKPAPGT